MTKNKKVVIIGVDGVPYRLMEKLSNKDSMPNFKELRKEGIFSKMFSSIPEISSVSWSSIITGKNPGEHGIYGFTNIINGTYTMSFSNFKNLKVPTFWQKDNKKYVIMNVPSTYPAQKINGFIVSGFVSPDLQKSVFPQSYFQKLQEFNYKTDIDSEKGHKSKTLLFKELFEVLDTRMKACRYFWSEIKWDVFMFVFTGSDRLGHFLWDAYENHNHEYHSQFLEFFKKIDDRIGEINNKLDEDDSLIILSDHGMESIDTNVNLNTFLVEEGFLSLKNDAKMRYNNIKDGAKAFILFPGRVYLNKKGKYPRGCVEKNEEEKLIENLIDSFIQLERSGKKVIKKAYVKEDIYHGKYLGNAPDIVLLSNPGFNLRGNLLRKNIFEDDVFSGKHTQENAFIFVKDSEAKNIIPKEPSVEDIVPILNKLNG